MRISGPAGTNPIQFQSSNDLPSIDIIKSLYNLRYALGQLNRHPVATQPFQLLLMAKAITRLWNMLQTTTSDIRSLVPLQDALRANSSGKPLYQLCQEVVAQMASGQAIEISYLHNACMLLPEVHEQCDKWFGMYQSQRAAWDPALEQDKTKLQNFFSLLEELSRDIGSWKTNDKASTIAFASNIRSFYDAASKFGADDGIEQFFLDDLLNTPMIAYDSTTLPPNQNWTLIGLANTVRDNPDQWTLLANVACPEEFSTFDNLDAIIYFLHQEYQGHA